MTREDYFKSLGINPDWTENDKDHKKVIEAYRKSHEIRQFEISLYWTRSAYLWTVQAAALAGLALVAEKFESLGWSCADLDPSSCLAVRLRLIIVVAIWAFGTFSAYIWLLLLKGAKHWQDNWERHVDLLEDYVSGALYKTYASKRTAPPYSVSKLNELMAWFMLILWLIVGSISSSLIIHEVDWVFPPLILITSVCISFWYADSSVRMEEDGELFSSDCQGVKAPLYRVRRRPLPLTPVKTAARSCSAPLSPASPSSPVARNAGSSPADGLATDHNAAALKVERTSGTSTPFPRANG